ncbi:hypothetical protein MANES_05G128400v8 [Manihot esculenta]|uniref:Uncharacterized protein n=1 Tax=Manihot esculenta TaxID=3983 RepID=A0ACB7HNX1_MANES|nr:hypothetical protein MANES_05G128400v8 [Manihot esculenta]
MSFYFLFFNFNFNNSSRKRTYHRKSTRIAPPSQAPRPQGLKAKSKTLCFICSWCCGVFNLKMTEGGGSSVSRRQRRLKRDSEDQCQNLKQKCLKMDNPADDAQKNGTDTNNGLLPGTSGEEKCIMIEGYKYFFGEKGLLLRAEPMDKADLEKLENTEEKRALEKKMAREWKRIAKAAIAYHNHQERVNFKLVKVVECKTISDHGIWYHLNFEAKPRDFECSPKLFFAELYGNALRVTCCCMLKSKGSGLFILWFSHLSSC